MTTPRNPRRLLDVPTSEVRALVAAAAAFEPPAGARERIWEGLVTSHARLLEAAPDAATAALLAADRAFEPPADAQERIFRRVLEEALVREGVAEPRRLADSDDVVAPLVAAAVAREPPFGRQARVLRSVVGRQAPVSLFARPRFALASGLLLAAAAVLVLALRPAPQATTIASTPAAPAKPPESLTNPAPPNALATSESLDAGAAGRLERRLPGIGELVLSGASARLEIARADDGSVRLVLASGRVTLHADKRRPAFPLVVAANGTEVRVVGTVFAVEAVPGGANVFVLEGLVEVRHPKGTARLAAGDALRQGVPSRRPEAWAQAEMLELAARSSLTGAEALASARPPRAPPRAAPTRQPPASRPVATTTPTAAASSRAAERESTAAYLVSLRTEAGKYADLPPDALRQFARNSLEQRENDQALAALFALAHHPQTPVGDRSATLVQLADLIDALAGRPYASVALLERLVRESPARAPSARFTLLQLRFELGEIEEARAAAEACATACAEEQRPIALFVRARILQEAGDPSLIEAARELRQVPQGARATALSFAGRADHLFGLHQVARARRAAAFALALEPRGPHAERLRFIIGDR